MREKAKKVVLAKLPEENKDGWAQLEQNMYKETEKKEAVVVVEKEVLPVMQLKKVESVPVVFHPPL
jgi:hypothetical protein